VEPDAAQAAQQGRQVLHKFLRRQHDVRDDAGVGAPQSQHDLALGVDPFR
jgi:hypothetical protein